jgi:hypothetical protein
MSKLPGSVNNFDEGRVIDSDTVDCSEASLEHMAGEYKKGHWSSERGLVTS